MFAYTETEKQEVLEKYFEITDSFSLMIFPKKQKLKYLCLLWIQTQFKKGTEYSEKKVNEILKDIYPDYVMLRRYLVDYGLLFRELDGSKYWI